MTIVDLRFFAGETDLALGKALAAARRDVVHPGHPRLPEVPRGTLDEDWIPIVGERSLVVITRDKRIRKRTAELSSWKVNGLRGFALTGKTSQSTWDSLRALAARWDSIEAAIATRPDGPWLYSATAVGGIREIDLP